MTVLAVLLMRWHGVLAYKPALLEALAPRPVSTQEGINLNDARAVVQPFRFEKAGIKGSSTIIAS